MNNLYKLLEAEKLKQASIINPPTFIDKIGIEAYEEVVERNKRKSMCMMDE